MRRKGEATKSTPNRQSPHQIALVQLYGDGAQWRYQEIAAFVRALRPGTPGQRAVVCVLE